jgi:hypothetical protein
MSDKKPLIYAPRAPGLQRPSLPIPELPQLPSRPMLQAPRIVRPYKPQPSPFLNYDDPYQINSIADIILTTFNTNMKRKPFYIGDVNISDIPILNILPGIVQYTNDAYIEPIKQGQWGAVGLNTLTNFGEIMDVVANPVKGLILEGPEGFMNAIGAGGRGRQNYDYDTGNIIADMALELVSDPLNWVTLFGKGALTIPLKQLAKTSLSEIAEESGQTLSKKAYRKILNVIAEEFIKGNDKQLADKVITLVKKMAQSKHAPVEFTEAFLKNLKKFKLDGATVDILRTTSKVINVFEGAEKVLFRAGIGLPYAIGYIAAKSGSAVQPFITGIFQESLKKFLTPSGNVDILKVDKIQELINKSNWTFSDIMELKEQLPPDTFEILVREAAMREKDAIWHYLTEDLANMPNINPEGKLRLFQEYLVDKKSITPTQLIEILQDLNIEHNGKYQWLYNMVTKTLNQEHAAYATLRQNIWTMTKDVRAKIDALKDLPAVERYAAFEKYLAEVYNTTPFDFLQHIKDVNIDFRNEFKWFEDYISGTIERFEKAPVYDQRKAIMKEIKELLDDPKPLEAQSRFKLIDSYVRKEHGIGIIEYIDELKKLNTKYPGVFDKYIADLEHAIERLKFIDQVSADFAAKRAASATATETAKHINKAQQDALIRLPKRAQQRLQRNFVQGFLENSNYHAQLRWEGLNPQAYQKEVLGTKFTPATKKAYLARIKDFYFEFVNKYVLDEVLNPDLLKGANQLTLKEYKSAISQLNKAFNIYWKTLEASLSKQISKGAIGFKVMKIFENVQDELTKLIEDLLPGLAEYQQKLALIMKPNKHMDFKAAIKKNAKKLEEVFNHFIGLGGNEDLAHLKDHIITLAKEPAMTPHAFKVLQRDFTRDLREFFVTKKGEGGLVEILNTWFDAFVEPNKNINIAREYFINNFEDLFAALARNDFEDFLDTADDIVRHLYVIGMQNKESRELIQPLWDMFKNYNLNNYKPIVWDIQAGEVWYQLKLEQNWVMMKMLADDSINNYIDELMTPDSPLGRVFKNMLQAEEPEAQALFKSLVSYKNYTEFLTDLYEYIGDPNLIKHSTSETVLNAFVSTLQKYALREPKSLMEKLAGNFYYIIEQTEQQINAMEMPRSFSLDKMIPELEQNPKYKALLEKLEPHHALDDAKRTWVVCQEELQDVFRKTYGDNVRIVHVDLESFGTNPSINSIREIGMYSPELNIEEEFIYNKGVGLGRANVARTVRPDTAGVNSEADIIKAFVNRLEQLPEGTVINMHNGRAFDKPFFYERFAQYHHEALQMGNKAEADYWLHARALFRSGKYKFSDSLKMLQAKAGFTVIDDFTRDALYIALANFVDAQKGMGRLIQPIDPNLARQLKDISEKLRAAIDDIPSSKPRKGNFGPSIDMADIMEHLDEFDDEGAVLKSSKFDLGRSVITPEYEAFFNKAAEIYDFFKLVKHRNRELGNTLINKAVFDDPKFQKYYGVFNITQALGTADGEIVDGVRPFAVRTFLDSDAVMDYFEGTHLGDYQMRYRTSIAKDIDRLYGLLRHSPKIKYYDQTTRTLLQTFLDRARALGHSVPPDLLSLKVQADPAANFAILQKLFSYTSEDFRNVEITKVALSDGRTIPIYADNLLDGICGKDIPPDLRILLENPEQVRMRAYTEGAEMTEALDDEVAAIREAMYQERYAAQKAEQQARWQEARDEYLQRKYEEYQRKAAALAASDSAVPNFVVDAYSKLKKTLKLDDELANYEAYHKATQDAVDDAVDIQDMLNRLGDNRDTAGASRALIQVRATSAEEYLNLRRAVEAVHAKITDPEVHFKQIMKYRDIIDAAARQQIKLVLDLSDDDLFAQLATQARRLIAIDLIEVDPAQLKLFIGRTKGLKDRGIQTLFKDNKLFIYLDNTVELDILEDVDKNIIYLANGKRVDPPRLPMLDFKSLADEILSDAGDADIRKHLLAVYDKLYNLVGDYNTGFSPHYGSIGELTTKAYYLEVFEKLPDEIKKVLPPKDLLYHDKFFNGGVFNHSILGSSAFRREFYQYTPSDILSTLKHTITLQIQHVKSHVEYMNMFFDKSLTIDNGYLASVSDQELLQALQSSSEYRLAALVQDKKIGARVIDMNPKSVGDIKKARELGAVIMDYETYSTAFSAINSYGMRHSKMNMLSKIMYLYKVGYLMTPGALMRNVIDSVAKNYVEAADDPLGMTQAFLTAWQLYWKYRADTKDLIKASAGKITNDTVKEYFGLKLSRLSKELYDFVHGFDVDGASGGLIKEWEQYFLRGKKYGLYGTVIQITNMMMEPTKVVEQVCRLAEYIWALEKGMNTIKAYALIAKTHFDYAIKTQRDRLIELIFPFYTFTMNNIHFWLDAFDRVPALGSILRDIYTPIWNLDSHEPDEFQYNRSLQYQLLSGNLPLERFVGESAKNMTLKLNPSFMDVYQLATDPINTIRGKLNPLFQAASAYAGAGLPEEMKYAYGIPVTAPGFGDSIEESLLSLTDLMPIAGPIINRLYVQGPKYYKRTGNILNKILPSVFGATAESKEFKPYIPKTYGRNFTTYKKIPKTKYFKKTYARRKWPKKTYAKRMWPKKTYATKYYPKKTYSSVGYAVDNFYKKLYNPVTGKSRLKAMMVPVTGQTLKTRLKDMVHYYR